MDEPISEPIQSPVSSAWIRAVGVWFLACLLWGVGCFVVLGEYFKHWSNHFWAAVWWEVCFVVALLPIMAVIAILLRKQNEGLSDIGWRKPTSVVAVALALVLLVSYVFGMHMGVHYLLKGSLLEFHWIRLALLPAGLMIGIGEEMIMRGYFMNELKRARVPTWLQVVLSATCSAAYHSFTDPFAFLSSFVLFGFLALIFVVGRRSLTAPILFHSLAHMLCDPYPLNLALHQM